MTDDMFDFDKRYEPTPLGHSKLAQYVCRRLPEDYMINDRDLKWLDECNSFLRGEPTNESITAATEDALICNPAGHIDPFELLIDAKICDTHCKPLGVSRSGQPPT